MPILSTQSDCLKAENHCVENGEENNSKALFKQSSAVEVLDNSKLSDRNLNTQKNHSRWNAHLGAILFLPLISKMHHQLGEFGHEICQFLLQILLGAHNLEQVKLQSRSDWMFMLGDELMGMPDNQRKKLKEIADDTAHTQQLLYWNYQLVCKPTDSDFYYDPHVKHYTGEQNVLKGWCSKIRWADKIINSDVIHNHEGAPVYLEVTDNYLDMRERFKTLHQRFRTCMKLPSEQTLSFIIDRGIYSKDLFEWVLSQPNLHLITWEKDYPKGEFAKSEQIPQSFVMQRPRNHKDNLQSYHFEWVQQPWPKNAKINRILVIATNLSGAKIELSILCTDTKRDPRKVILLMLKRWLQENDFKYLIAHFGINGITSYESQSYADLQDELEDRQMQNAEYTAVQKVYHAENDKVSKLLLQNRQSTQKHSKLTRQIADLEKDAVDNPQLKQKLGRLKGSLKSTFLYIQKREKKILEIEDNITLLKEKQSQTQETASRLETLIAKDSVRLVSDKKNLLDVIKIVARNVFYQALEPFKQLYNNYRDDHVWFRHLSECGGVTLMPSDAQDPIQCYLVLKADLPQKVRQCFDQIIDQFNQSQSTTLTSPYHKIKLKIIEKEAIEIANTNSSLSL